MARTSTIRTDGTVLRDRGRRPEPPVEDARRRRPRIVVVGVTAALLLATASVALAFRPRSEEKAPVSESLASAIIHVRCGLLRCVFSDATKVAPGDVSSREWTFGDGARASSRNPVHVYERAGTFVVELVLTDRSGRKFRAVRKIAPDEAAAYLRVYAKGTSTPDGRFRLFGSLQGPGLECAAGAQIQRRQGRSWALIRRLRIAKSGTFAVNLAPAPGTFRVSVPPNRNDDGLICEGATSDTVTHARELSGGAPPPTAEQGSPSIPPVLPGPTPTPTPTPQQPDCPAGQDRVSGECMPTQDRPEGSPPVRG